MYLVVMHEHTFLSLPKALDSQKTGYSSYKFRKKSAKKHRFKFNIDSNLKKIRRFDEISFNICNLWFTSVKIVIYWR